MSLSHHPNIVRNGLVAYFDAANPKSYPAGQDPYVNNVSLMLSMDGANGSTTFTDSSANALSVTAFGNVQISTNQTKYGSASAYFDGNGDYVTAPSGSLFQFSGDFTVEFWAYSTETSGSSVRGMFDTRSSQPSTSGIMLRENGAGYLVYGNGTTLITTGSVRTANTWVHLALVRSGSTITLYVNGTSAGTATNSTNYSDGQCLISGFVDTKATPYGFLGYIDDFRITKAARYTANFTPPVAPLSLPGRLTDLTTNKNNLNFNGSNFNYNNSYISITKTGAYPSIPPNPSINLNGQVTVECAIRPTSLDSTWNIIASKWFGGTTSEWHWSFKASAGGYKQNLYTTGNSDLYGSKIYTNNVWYIVSFTINTSGLLTFYSNGVSENSYNSVVMSASDSYLYLSDFRASVYGFNGDYSMFRLYNRALSANEILQNYNATKSRYG